MASLIAFMIIGYVEVSPGQCQIDYFKYDKTDTLVIPCYENETLEKKSVLIIH